MKRVDHFFDINAMIGSWNKYKLHYSEAAVLAEYMKQFNITGAAVSEFDELHWGNEKLFQQIAPYPEMKPCPDVCLMMDAETGYDSLGDYLDMLRAEHDVKMVRVRPLHTGCSITNSMYQPLLNYLAEHKMPMLIDLEQMKEQLDDVDRLCAANPELRVIVLHQTHERSRGVYALLKQYQNLYFETSFMSDQEELEQVVEYAGSRGLVWGSRMPFFEPGRMVARMTYSQLPTADLQAICFGNAERLLDEVR